MKTYIDKLETFETTIIDKLDQQWAVKCSLDGTVSNDYDEHGKNYDYVAYIEIQDIFLNLGKITEYFNSFEAMKNSNQFDKLSLKFFETECEERILEDHSLLREERLSK